MSRPPSRPNNQRYGQTIRNHLNLNLNLNPNPSLLPTRLTLGHEVPPAKP